MNAYYYGAARVRALETRLLNQNQLERMSGAPDFESAFNVLNETPYSELVPKLKNAFDIEEILRLEKEALARLMRKLAPEDPSMRALLNEDFAALANSSSALIRKMARHKLDLANLKTLLRSRAIGREKSFFEARLSAAGYLEKSTLLGLFSLRAAEIPARLSSTAYFPDLLAGFSYFEESGSFSLLEKSMDDFILDRFKKAKYVNCGIEPLAGFYLARTSEMQNIRFILTCKKNYVRPEKIKSRIRAGY